MLGSGIIRIQATYLNNTEQIFIPLIMQIHKEIEKKNCLIHWHTTWNWDSKSYHKNSIVRIFTMPIHYKDAVLCRPQHKQWHTHSPSLYRTYAHTHTQSLEWKAQNAGKGCKKNALRILHRYYHVYRHYECGSRTTNCTIFDSSVSPFNFVLFCNLCFSYDKQIQFYEPVAFHAWLRFNDKIKFYSDKK